MSAAYFHYRNVQMDVGEDGKDKVRLNNLIWLERYEEGRTLKCSLTDEKTQAGEKAAKLVIG